MFLIRTNCHIHNRAIAKFRAASLATIGLASSVISMVPAYALPPPDDQPEEVLRTEILVEARSPITGEPLTAQEYAELQAQLEAQQDAYEPTISPEIANLIRLLYIRRAIRTIFPFLLR